MTTYTTPALTVNIATEQARQSLAAAGLQTQVSRVVEWGTDDRAGWVSSVALLRIGADTDAVTAALAALPGAEVTVCKSVIIVYQPITPSRRTERNTP